MCDGAKCLRWGWLWMLLDGRTRGMPSSGGGGVGGMIIGSSGLRRTLRLTPGVAKCVSTCDQSITGMGMPVNILGAGNSRIR